VPEQGVYKLWIAQHPLFGQRALAIARPTSTPQINPSAIRPLPFQPALNSVFRSVSDPAERFIIRAMPCNHDRPGGLIDDAPHDCALRWTIDFDNDDGYWQLSGHLVDHPQRIQHDPESTDYDLWEFMEHWAHESLAPFGRWQAQERRLAVSSDKLTDQQRDSFE